MFVCERMFVINENVCSFQSWLNPWNEYNYLYSARMCLIAHIMHEK